MQCKMSGVVEIFVPVPQKYMGIVIGTRGRNINQLKEKTHTRIKSCNGDYSGKGSGFTVAGTVTDCEEVLQAIRRRVKKWEDDEVCRIPVQPAVASGSRTHSKVNGDVRKIELPKEYKYVVLGEGRKNIEKIETKSGTRIKLHSRRNTEAKGGDTIKLEITGPPKNCIRAESLIRSHIIAYKDKMMRNEFGGDTHFVCFDLKDENEKFRLKPDGSAPKLDGFIQGKRYRIETETDDDDDYQSDISDKTISEIKGHLLKSLQNLKKLNDEKQLIADLWCHFGKVLVSSVDEVESHNIITPLDINGRIKKISRATLNKKNKDSYWQVSFEEGVDPLDVNDGALPKFGDDNHRFLGLKLVHTQWRYDFAFITPSDRSVRLKAWEGLPTGSDDKPPVEVKYILTPVLFQAEEGIKAWICYPSTSVLRGEIMTPNSRYDCRMKLRAGFRYVTDKDSVCIEEDAVLSDYLSNCKFDEAKHRMYLPHKKDHEIPEGFECTFYREAKERIFQATVDGECFTVIVLDEKGWDSDSSDKRDQEQFGIRVVINSWSEALLSPERHWTPDEILDKLENYMGFLSLLKSYFFDG